MASAQWGQRVSRQEVKFQEGAGMVGTGKRSCQLPQHICVLNSYPINTLCQMSNHAHSASEVNKDDAVTACAVCRVH